MGQISNMSGLLTWGVTVDPGRNELYGRFDWHRLEICATLRLSLQRNLNMLAGQRLGPFEIEREVGSGAMGAVYLARYAKTGQQFAVKVMAPGLGSNEKALARFEREAEILKQLRHKNIVRIFGTGRHQKAPYYAMEYIEGEPLDKVLRRRDRYTWEEVVEIGRQICKALQHAHQHGIIHRDLKPSNLMILRDGTVKLTDFGIAKGLDLTQLTTGNCTVGTAAYMSPEQCKGDKNISHKSDLYSLGVVLYELLVGRKPFHAETALEMFMQHVKGKFVRPARERMDIPVWLDNLVVQLLEKKPENRPIDASMVSTVLNEVKEKVDTLKSAGVEQAARAIRRSKDETDRQAATVLMTATRGKKKKKRRKKRRDGPPVWITAAALIIGLAGIGGAITYVFWPASAEQLVAQGQELIQRGDEYFATGDTDSAWYEWLEAKEKFFEPAMAKGPTGQIAQDAQDGIAHFDAGDLYLDGLRRLNNTSLERPWQRAKEKGFDELIKNYPADNKFVMLAIEKLRPFEAPILLKEGSELIDSSDDADAARGRTKIETLVQRYPDSEEARQAQPMLDRIWAMETALALIAKEKRGYPEVIHNHATLQAVLALKEEEKGNLERAKFEWSACAGKDASKPEFRPWVELAKHRIKHWDEISKKLQSNAKGAESIEPGTQR